VARLPRPSHEAPRTFTPVGCRVLGCSVSGGFGCRMTCRGSRVQG
jgi:hypothetical protein